MTEPSAKIILDSISPLGHRLTTMEVTMHRFVLAEFNTHRVFCLSGDSQVWFRQPNGTLRKDRIREVYDKWANGAAPRPSKKGKDWQLDRLNPNHYYNVHEVAAILGMASATNLNAYCRSGRIKGAYKNTIGVWHATGEAFISALQPTENRQPLKGVMKGMALDQINEDTLDLGLTTLEDVIYSGIKDVYEVTVEGHSIKASKDHLFFTPEGWRTLGELAVHDKVAVVKYGKKNDDKKGDRFKYVNGRWVSQWVRSVKKDLPSHCQCGSEATEAHHIVPVHKDPNLAFEFSNLIHVCNDCHNEAHRSQGWQEGVPSYADYGVIQSIEYVGKEDTYDLTVSGEYPNFIANGFVVHNSRNSASSRAIPIDKQIDRILDDTAFPVEYGSNQSGMQAGDEIVDTIDAKVAWGKAADYAVMVARELQELGVHKQVTNRLLEPFMWHTVIVTATEWDGFWKQRCSPLAQPEIRVVAEAMKACYDASVPVRLDYGEWHTPYILDDEDFDIETAKKVSAARCARVSYLTHDGVRDVEKDLGLFNHLVSADPPHASPLEHVATPCRPLEAFGTRGNFTGWNQLRHVYWPDY